MKINVGVLGSGNMAREHIKIFKDIKEFEIVGVVGRGKKNINKTKKKFSRLIFFKTLKELFNNVKIDLLVICINEDLIIKKYKEILKYNCIFLFEKPLGINYSETKKILGAGIVGPSAGDLISEACLAIEMGSDAEDIGLTIHPHPTIGETFAAAAEVFSGTITDLYIPKKGAR